jgi:hypothetical protein
MMRSLVISPIFGFFHVYVHKKMMHLLHLKRGKIHSQYACCVHDDVANELNKCDCNRKACQLLRDTREIDKLVICDFLLIFHNAVNAAIRGPELDNGNWMVEGAFLHTYFV